MSCLLARPHSVKFYLTLVDSYALFPWLLLMTIFNLFIFDFGFGTSTFLNFCFVFRGSSSEKIKIVYSMNATPKIFKEDVNSKSKIRFELYGDFLKVSSVHCPFVTSLSVSLT